MRWPWSKVNAEAEEQARASAQNAARSAPPGIVPPASQCECTGAMHGDPRCIVERSRRVLFDALEYAEACAEWDQAMDDGSLVHGSRSWERAECKTTEEIAAFDARTNAMRVKTDAIRGRRSVARARFLDALRAIRECEDRNAVLFALPTRYVCAAIDLAEATLRRYPDGPSPWDGYIISLPHQGAEAAGFVDPSAFAKKSPEELAEWKRKIEENERARQRAHREAEERARPHVEAFAAFKAECARRAQ